MTRQVDGKTHSNSFTVSTGGSGNEPASDLFTEINNIVEDSKSNVSAWQDKQDKYYRMRMRVKKKKNYPFKDSSNLRMPTADVNIKKVKAAIMQQIFGANPIVQAVPTPSGSVDVGDKIAKFLDHLIIDVMEIKNKAEIGIDQSLEKGFYLAKAFWRLTIEEREEIIDFEKLSDKEKEIFLTGPEVLVLTEVVKRLGIDLDDNVADNNLTKVREAIAEARKTQKEVKFRVKDVIYNFPDIDFISPSRVFVPTDSGVDPQKATSLTIEFFKPMHVLKSEAKRKGYDLDVLNTVSGLKINDSGSNSIKEESYEQDKDQREGISRMSNPSNLVRIWETFGFLNIDGNKSNTKKPSVVTSLPDFHKVIRKVERNNFSHKYPVVKFFYELTEDRWFSHRGIPEALEDIIKEIDVQHNMKIDGQTMRNAPMIVYRAGMVNPRTAKANPASAIPVQGLQSLDDTIKAINLHNPNAEFSYEREQQILETKIQEYVGQIDFGLQSQINRREPRTLGEVELQQSNASATFSLDSSHYINAFSQLFQMIFELWSEFGPDSYEFNYMGKTAEPMKLKLSKEEIQGKYNIKVRGNDQNTNPQIKLQKAQQIITASTDETLIAMGVVGPSQAAEGLKRFYQALGIENWESLVNEEPQPQQPDPTADIKIATEDMTDSEMAQLLAKRGIEPDAPGRTRKQAIETAESAADIASKIGEDNEPKKPARPRAPGPKK